MVEQTPLKRKVLGSNPRRRTRKIKNSLVGLFFCFLTVKVYNVFTMIAGTDYIGLGVCYFCHDGAGNIVMSKRNQNARDEKGRWDIGGGAVEFGSTAEETLRKEIKEEYCTDVLDFEFIGFRDVFREHEGKNTHWLMLDYKVLVNKTMVANGEPHKFDEVAWFSVECLPENIHSQLKFFLKKYNEKLSS